MAQSPSYDSTGIEFYEIPEHVFRNGSKIPVRVAYRSYNDTSPKKVLVPTCYGGLINETLALNAPDQALADHHVIVVAMLGNGESTSPSNTPDFPRPLHYQDCISAQYELVTKHLHFDSLDAVVGFSMGGQQAYYWACMYPDFVRHVVPICGSARTSGHNYAFLEGPKCALINSVDYVNRKGKELPQKGLRAFGRAYSAWLTSGAWYRDRLWQKNGFESIEAQISGMAEISFEYWDPEDLLTLAWMWQHADVGTTLSAHGDGRWAEPNGNLRQQDFEAADKDYEVALKEKIHAKVLVMPCRTDQYFAWQDSETEVNLMGSKGELAIIESVWGHTAGGGDNPEDVAWMSQRIKKFLESGLQDNGA